MIWHYSRVDKAHKCYDIRSYCGQLVDATMEDNNNIPNNEASINVNNDRMIIDEDSSYIEAGGVGRWDAQRWRWLAFNNC